MKIQELAIIFIIIILPISLLLSEYTQYQIKTINLQTEYDAKLTAATYDAIKAFQLNSTNSTTSSLINSKMRDIEASVNSFRNSIMAGFALNGYTEEALNNYIPALVYTMYDGFYIYSPYTNENHRYLDNETNSSITKLEPTASDTEADENGMTLFGLKPYITYSCRYKKENSTDVVITYALDNYVSVQGKVDGNYVNESGYLIDNIEINGDEVRYNNVIIENEHLKEYLPIEINGVASQSYSYAKINGTKYYFVEDYIGDTDCIIYILNGSPIIQYREGDTQFISWKHMILNNNSAVQFYKDAKRFTNWFKGTSLKDLRYSHAVDEVIIGDVIEITNVWPSDDRQIFKFNSTLNANNNIENELSEFNQHRLAVIRNKIETNLAVAISNYNAYSKSDNVFQMPELKEDEWEHIIHNISLISFLQGLPIGGKIYNGYSIVTNAESKEVVLEDYIYILGGDNNYHKIGDTGFETGGSLTVNAGNYEGSSNANGKVISAGRLNLDFEKSLILESDSTSSQYYYPLKEYKASYDSVVMQNKVTTYDDIYAYVNKCGNEDLKKAFYTALGRERYALYKSNNTTVEFYNILIAGKAAGDNNYTESIRQMLEGLSADKEIKATYVYNNNESALIEKIEQEKYNYHLIIVDSFAWAFNSSTREKLKDISNVTNLITISNDQTGLKIMQSGGTTMSESIAIATQTKEGKKILGEIAINGNSDSSQNAIRFRNDEEINVTVLYEGAYKDRNTGAAMGDGYHLIGCWKNGNYKWIHSQISFSHSNANHMKVLKELVKYALDID